MSKKPRGGRSSIVVTPTSQYLSKMLDDLRRAHPGTGVDATVAQTVDMLLPSASSVQVSIFDNLGTPVISWSRDVAACDLASLPGRRGTTPARMWPG